MQKLFHVNCQLGECKKCEKSETKVFLRSVCTQGWLTGYPYVQGAQGGEKRQMQTYLMLMGIWAGCKRNAKKFETKVFLRCVCKMHTYVGQTVPVGHK